MWNFHLTIILKAQINYSSTYNFFHNTLYENLHTSSLKTSSCIFLAFISARLFYSFVVFILFFFFLKRRSLPLSLLVDLR